MVDIFQEDLKDIREQIDDIDRQMIQLLSRRKKLTDEVVKFKSEHHSRVFDPLIEETVLGWRRDYAERESNISPDMVEDIFRLVMYDAYHLADISYQRVLKAKTIREIIVVGKKQGYNALLNQLFTKSGYETRVFESSSELEGYDVAKVDAVFITTPYQQVLETLQKQPGFSQNTLVVLFGGLEARSMDYLGNVYSGPTLGLQPMFSAGSKTLTKEIIFICHGNLATRYLWMLDQIKMWGLIPVQAPPSDFGKLMTVISGLNSLINMADADRLLKQNIDINTLVESVGPSLRIGFMNLGRHFSANKDFNVESLFEVKTIKMFRQYSNGVSQILQYLDSGNKDALEAKHKEICEWFGDSADAFDDEANRITKLQPFVQMNDTLNIND